MMIREVDNVKIKIVVLILFIIIVVIGIAFLIYKIINNAKSNNCAPISGGSFHVNFVVNGGYELPDMLVGVACSPDSYKDIPIPVRDGYSFDGWYYDKDYTQKIEFTNSINFKPIPKFDNKKCQVGFENIEVYAKWSKY